MRQKSTAELTTTLAAFELKLPKIFNPEPAHVVDLPGGRKAHIYDTTWLRHTGGDNHERVPGWRVVVFKKDGFPQQPFRNGNRYYHGNGNSANVLGSELDVQIYLQELVLAFTPSKSRRVETEEFSDD